MTDHDAPDWTSSGSYDDIRYETTSDGIAKITICRPEVHNAFRPQTIIEISEALDVAREDERIGVIVLSQYDERPGRPRPGRSCVTRSCGGSSTRPRGV